MSLIQEEMAWDHKTCRDGAHTFLKDVTDLASRSTTTSMGLDFGGSVSTTCTCKNLRYSRL